MNTPTLRLGLLSMILVAVVTTGAMPGIATAQESSTDQLSAEELELQVFRHLRKLDAPQLATRDEAEQALVDLGPQALPLLRIDEGMSAEKKSRLTRIQKKLQLAAAASALEPTEITLKGEISLVDAIAKIEAQTGNQLLDYRARFGGAAEPINLQLDLERSPFWTAIDEVLEQADLDIYHFPGEQGLALVNRNESEADRTGRASYAGPFRLEPVLVEAIRDLRNPANAALKVKMAVAWEPRLAPIMLSMDMSKVEATSGAGEKLPVAFESEIEVPIQSGTSAVEMVVPLELPPRSVEKIARLQGELAAVVPGRIETFKFSKLKDAKRVEQKRGGVSVWLDNVRQSNTVWEIRMRAVYDEPSQAFESHRGWLYDNPAYVLDENGKRIDHIGYETTSQSQNSIGFAYVFDLPQGPDKATFVYETPATIFQMPVAYEIENIVLP